jgi:archaellum biogenesis protein FlaJ (TadC family)
MSDTGTTVVADLAAKLESLRNWAAFLNEENSMLEARIAEARHAIRVGAEPHEIAVLLGDNTREAL